MNVEHRGCERSSHQVVGDVCRLVAVAVELEGDGRAVRALHLALHHLALVLDVDDGEARHLPLRRLLPLRFHALLLPRLVAELLVAARTRTGERPADGGRLHRAFPHLPNIHILFVISYSITFDDMFHYLLH